MTYRGKIQNGVVVLDEAPIPPEGTVVEVSVVEQPEPPSWAEVLKDVIGKAEGLPTDLARNHDHYIHGASARH